MKYLNFNNSEVDDDVGQYNIIQSSSK